MTKSVALVALPWSHVARPAAAIGTLSAYLERELPEVEVGCFYNYVDVALTIGPRLYDHLATFCYELGEILYLPLLYPDRKADVAAFVATKLAERLADSKPGEFVIGAASWLEVAEHAQVVLAEQIALLAQKLSPAYGVVGLTTCFGQVFANIALARAIKAISPDTTIILGGSSVSSRVGPSLLAEYDCLDFVIQGEGEKPLVELLRRLEADPLDTVFEKGVLSRSNAARFPQGVPLLEVGRLDDLPLPDFDAYADLARRHGITWDLPIEGSRGCWWDRVKKSGNAKDTCYFCNLNVQWNGYRQKSEERVVREVRELGDRYANGRIFFLDNIIRHQGLDRLAELLAGLGRDLELFYEMRANVRPAQFVALWQAGLKEVQVGIEGLSSSFLKRVGKGTSTIQNLEAMKLCFELGIQNNSNLILDFPTSTEAEVAETVETIERYAICYEPLHMSVFELGVGATTEVLAEKFNLSDVRNAELYKVGMPLDVWGRLQVLSNLSFKNNGLIADWSPVVAAVKRWQARHAAATDRKDRLFLSYEDGGSYLRIRDRRERFKDHTLRGVDRQVYLYCCEIRRVEQVVERFGTTEALAARVRKLIDAMVERRLMFRDKDRVLSLAVARSPQAAVRRVQAWAAEVRAPAELRAG